MPVFSYSGNLASGERRAGTIAADSPRAARDELRRTGLVIRSMTEVAVTRAAQDGQPWSPADWLSISWGARHQAEASSMIRELATLLGVGLPVIDSLETVLRQHPRGGFRVILLKLKDRVRSGVSLADAMAEHPRVFSKIAISLVQVGEQAGHLDVVLGYLADFQERSAALKDKVVTALLYPLVVLVCAVGVSLFLMTFVIPMLLEGLLQAGKPLPWPTQVLKWTSDLMVNYGLHGGAIFVLGLSALGAWWRTARGRKVVDRLALRAPVLGDLIRQQGLARVAMVLAVLLRSGIEFLNALAIASTGVGNVVLRKAFDDCRTAVGAGTDFGPALESTGVFPPVVVQVFAVGQQSGQLEDLLERLAVDYDRRASTQAGRLATVLEPILIIGLSILVGFILFATILPILEAGNVL